MSSAKRIVVDKKDTLPVGLCLEAQEPTQTARHQTKRSVFQGRRLLVVQLPPQGSLTGRVQYSLGQRKWHDMCRCVRAPAVALPAVASCSSICARSGRSSALTASLCSSAGRSSIPSSKPAASNAYSRSSLAAAAADRPLPFSPGALTLPIQPSCTTRLSIACDGRKPSQA